MKKTQITIYVCEICGESYDSERKAIECESRPITQDKGIQVGDFVLVIHGDGKGQIARVEKRSIISRTWGHYQWERYWHTVGVEVKLDLGSTFLTFDGYELPY